MGNQKDEKDERCAPAHSRVGRCDVRANREALLGRRVRIGGGGGL